MQRFYKSAEFYKYIVVGSSGFLVNMGIFVLLTRIFLFSVEIASPIAIESAIISNFILNNFWTFRSRTVETSLLKRFVRFHMVALTAGLVNYATLLIFYYALGFMDIIANTLGIIAATMVNFLLNSYWTWKTSSDI